LAVPAPKRLLGIETFNVAAADCYPDNVETCGSLNKMITSIYVAQTSTMHQQEQQVQWFQQEDCTLEMNALSFLDVKTLLQTQGDGEQNMENAF
jgi:hypothetical protein